MEFHPAFVEEDVSCANYTKIPLSRIPALGTAFEPLVTAAQNVFGSGSPTIYITASIAGALGGVAVDIDTRDNLTNPKII